MAGESNVIYLYDGTYDGMLCCVWTAFSHKENPQDIWCYDDEQPTFFTLRDVATEPELAERVQTGIRRKLGALAEQWVWDAYYSSLPRREIAALEFLKLGFAKGPCVTAMVGHPQVAPLFAASRALHSEVHLLSGFIRFAERGGVLTSVIRPKNFVLPFLEPHFSARFPRENYMIYDETHRYALVVSHGKSRLLQAEDVHLPALNEEEQRYLALWKQFYDTIEVRDRHNPKCRMTHVPKRYWDCMDELRGEKAPLPVSVRQAIAAGELSLPQAEAAPPAITTPTQVSVANARQHRMPVRCPLPADFPPEEQTHESSPGQTSLLIST